MLEFEDLTLQNWAQYEKPILQSEDTYPEAVRSDKQDFLDSLEDEMHVAIVAKVDSAYAGNVIGYPLANREEMEFHQIDLPADPKMIYVFNFIVDSPYQGRGYGKKLLMEFIRLAKEKGYERMVGHFRKNSSFAMIKRLGGKEIKTFTNWEGGDEDYVLCVLEFRDVPS
jgi:GNAT superfamily N-acetyltransferase